LVERSFGGWRREVSAKRGESKGFDWGVKGFERV
jgi:hypothetical protein